MVYFGAEKYAQRLAVANYVGGICLFDGMSVLKMRILFCLSELEQEGCTVTHLARLFGVAKSTVSRAVEWCGQNNLISREEGRNLALTPYGAKIAQIYRTRKDVLFHWLVSEGVPSHAAEQDGIRFSLCCCEETAEAVRKSIPAARLAEQFQGGKTLSGRELCSLLPSGRYEISFTLLRLAKSDRSCCAIQELEGMGELTVRQGSGLVSFRQSGADSAVYYQEDCRYQQAGKEGKTVFFPVSGMQFCGVGQKRLVQGWTVLRVSPSKRCEDCPEGEVIFTIFL